MTFQVDGGRPGPDDFAFPSPQWHHGRVSEEQKKSDNRPRPTTEAFRAFVRDGWAPRPDTRPERSEVAPYAAARRDAVSAAYPGERLVIPAGGLKVRSNDCDYTFRPHSAFAHLSGFRADCEPDTVLVMHPRPEAEGGGQLVYQYDDESNHGGIARLLAAVEAAGIGFADISTRQTSLEDIFVSLIGEGR